jgi:hypothetical protein
VYEFSVYHLMDVEDQCELFPMEIEKVEQRRCPQMNADERG